MIWIDSVVFYLLTKSVKDVTCILQTDTKKPNKAVGQCNNLVMRRLNLNEMPFLHEGLS